MAHATAAELRMRLMVAARRMPEVDLRVLGIRPWPDRWQEMGEPLAHGRPGARKVRAHVCGSDYPSMVCREPGCGAHVPHPHQYSFRTLACVFAGCDRRIERYPIERADRRRALLERVRGMLAERDRALYQIELDGDYAAAMGEEHWLYWSICAPAQGPIYAVCEDAEGYLHGFPLGRPCACCMGGPHGYGI